MQEVYLYVMLNSFLFLRCTRCVSREQIVEAVIFAKRFKVWVGLRPVDIGLLVLQCHFEKLQCALAVSANCFKAGEVVKTVIGAKPKPQLEADFAEWLK